MEKVNNIGFIDYLDEKAGIRPTCRRCQCASHVWAFSDEWVCKDCLTKEEAIQIVSKIEELLKYGFSI